MRAAGVDDPGHPNAPPPFRIIAGLRISRHRDRRQFPQRLGCKISTLGPHDSATDRIDGSQRKIVRTTQRLKQRSTEQRLNVDRAFIDIIKSQCQVKRCGQRKSSMCKIIRKFSQAGRSEARAADWQLVPSCRVTRVDGSRPIRQLVYQHGAGDRQRRRPLFRCLRLPHAVAAHDFTIRKLATRNSRAFLRSGFQPPRLDAAYRRKFGTGAGFRLMPIAPKSPPDATTFCH